MPLFREEKYNASALVSEISNADNTQTISAQSFMLIPLTNNISNSQQTHNVEATVKWASTRENLSSEGCEQQRHRPACASAQSDQRLCFSLFGKYHFQTCHKRNFNFLASLCSSTDWLETHFVGNPVDRFCRDEAQIR